MGRSFEGVEGVFGLMGWGGWIGLLSSCISVWWSGFWAVKSWRKRVRLLGIPWMVVGLVTVFLGGGGTSGDLVGFSIDMGVEKLSLFLSRVEYMVLSPARGRISTP